MKLSLRAVELAPGQQSYLNTCGVVLYRAGQYAVAVTTLEKSLDAGKGQFDGFDLFFLAMAHYRLGHREEARRCLDRAIEWLGHPGPLSADQAKSSPPSAPRPSRSLPGRLGKCPMMSSIGRVRNTHFKALRRHNRASISSCGSLARNS